MKNISVALLVVALVAGGVFLARYLDEERVPAEVGDELVPDEVDPSPGPTGTPDEEDGPLRVADPVEPPPSGIYWGAFSDDVPEDEDELDDLIDDAGAVPAIVSWYVEWAGQPPFPADHARMLTDRGIVPMITWEAYESPEVKPEVEPQDAREVAEQPDYRLDRIADGGFDDYIEAFAADVAEYGGPLVLRIFHEMDGFWYPWGGTVNDNEPEDVAAAWRHIHDIFEREDATNVTWVWSVNHISVPEDQDIDDYWPGDEYVDWIGVSGFNFGATAEFSRWRTFEEVYEPRLEELATYDHPVMISEISSVEVGGDKAAWILDAGEEMRAREHVQAFLWFDEEIDERRDWRIASTDDAQDAFRRVVSQDGVHGAPEAIVTTGVAPSPFPEASPGTSPSPSPRPTPSPTPDGS